MSVRKPSVARKTPQRQRNSFTVREKIEIINLLASGTTQRDVARRKGISINTVKTIWQNKRKTLEHQDKFQNDKKIRRPVYEQVDGMLLSWFSVQRRNGVPVSSARLVAKAEEIAKSLGQDSFKGSHGWLERWKKRHAYARPVSAVAAVHSADADAWLKCVWPDVSCGYEPDDIFSCHEAALLFAALPDGAYRFEDRPGGRAAADRVTLLLCANSTGTEKLKPVVVGSRRRPRAFSRLGTLDNLPVTYESNAEAWITKELFTDWVTELDARMKKSRRSILLLCAGCAARPTCLAFGNVNLVALPPDVAPALQPLARGIVSNFKCLYRKLLIRKVLRKTDRGYKPSVDILEAVMMVDSAWRQVTPATIQRCFRRARLHRGSPMDAPAADDGDADDDAPLEDEFLQVLSERLTTDPPITLEEFAAVDDDVATCPSADDEVAAGCGTSDAEVTLSDDEHDEADESQQLGSSVPTTSEALEMLEKLKVCLMDQDADTLHLLNRLSEVESFFLSKPCSERRQTKVFDYLTSTDIC